MKIQPITAQSDSKTVYQSFRTLKGLILSQIDWKILTGLSVNSSWGVRECQAVFALLFTGCALKHWKSDATKQSFSRRLKTAGYVFSLLKKHRIWRF